VDKLAAWIIVSIIEKEEEMKNNSHWGPAPWTVKERDYYQRYFEFLFMENTPARTTHLPKVQWNWVWPEEGEFDY
jgi:hypothetical protein